MLVQHKELITDKNVFSALRTQCSTVFDIEKRLPEKVFQNKFERYCAFEHSQIGSESFAAYLVDMACRFSDVTVNYMTLEPDPVDYYFKHCGFYGVASFDPATLIDNYMKIMFRGGSADSFLARGGDVGVFWGSSLQWGIFCDRISWELCVMGFYDGLKQSIMNVFDCMNTQLIGDYISNEYRHKPVVASEFLRSLEKNYPDLFLKKLEQ